MAHEDVWLDCMGGFVVTMVYGFSQPTGDLDVLEIAPAEVGRSMLALGMRQRSFPAEQRLSRPRNAVDRIRKPGEAA